MRPREEKIFKMTGILLSEEMALFHGREDISAPSQYDLMLSLGPIQANPEDIQASCHIIPNA